MNGLRYSSNLAPLSPRVRAPVGLRTVALFEAAKGALVLLAGFGILALLHHDTQHAAERLVRQFHLNPANHHPRIFLQLAEQAAPSHLWLLAAGAWFGTTAKPGTSINCSLSTDPGKQKHPLPVRPAPVRSAAGRVRASPELS